MSRFLSICILASVLFLTACNQEEKFTHVIIETEFGNMEAKLYNTTPIHRDNFIKLAKEGFYDDLLFHRIIDGFMIQGGDPESKDAPADKFLGGGGPGYLLDAEISSPHIKGTLAAARTGGAGNPEKKSSGSQFYIVHGKPQRDATLNSIEKQLGIKYNSIQRKLYTEIGGTPQLDMEYTVFGELVSGLEVIDKIAVVKTNEQNRPLKDIKMKVKLK